MIYAGAWLARRLEAAEAANDAECIAAQMGTCAAAMAGGWALFAGVESPLTRAIGLGLEGVVSEAAVDALEGFFHSRGAHVAIDICPLASPELLDSLSRRGYRVAEFNNVMVRVLAGLPVPPDEAKVTPTTDAGRWAAVVGSGFFDRPHLTEDEIEVGLAVCRAGKSLCFLAQTEAGEAGAGAALSLREGTAVLFADGAIAAHRRQGLQQALIRQRIAVAIAQGCDLACAVTAPGSGSQRNYERAGFQVAYTKALLTEPGQTF